MNKGLGIVGDALKKAMKYEIPYMSGATVKDMAIGTGVAAGIALLGHSVINGNRRNSDLRARLSQASTKEGEIIGNNYNRTHGYKYE